MAMTIVEHGYKNVKQYNRPFKHCWNRYFDFKKNFPKKIFFKK